MTTIQKKLAALAAIGIHRDVLVLEDHFQVRSVAATGRKCATLQDVKDCLDRCLDNELHKMRNLQTARNLV